MPVRAPLGCRNRGCPNPQPCPDHPVTWRGRAMPRGWAATRDRVLARDPWCTSCGSAPSTDVHHSVQGSEEEHTLRGICHPCHAVVTAAQALAARRLASPA
jgi:hypothetical protein